MELNLDQLTLIPEDHPLRVRIFELNKERNEAFRVRDLAREASNRDLELKRIVEQREAVLLKVLENVQQLLQQALTTSKKEI